MCAEIQTISITRARKKTSWQTRPYGTYRLRGERTDRVGPVGSEWSRTDRTVSGGGGSGLDTFWEMIRFVGRVSKAACDVISTHDRRTQVGRLCSMAGNPSKRSPPPPPSPKKCPLPALPSHTTQSFFPCDPPPYRFPSLRARPRGHHTACSRFIQQTSDSADETRSVDSCGV